MAPQHAFAPHTFLAKVDTGRTLVAYHAQPPIFTQGEVDDNAREEQASPTVARACAEGLEVLMKK